jgi:hypothetical protein
MDIAYKIMKATHQLKSLRAIILTPKRYFARAGSVTGKKAGATTTNEPANR